MLTGIARVLAPLFLSTASVSLAVSIDRNEDYHQGFAEPQSRQCKTYTPSYNVSAVLDRALQLSSHSWEFGTASEALLEFDNPEYAVFTPRSFPIPRMSNPNDVPSLAYARRWIRLDNTTLIDGDGAAGDPASLGVSAVLLGQSDAAYLAAAQRQADHLLYDVPRMSNGAISHRDDSRQAWADFVYMGPPFLAYYAAATNNASLLVETVRQCGLYRELLQVDKLSWIHILVQSGTNGNGGADLGLWSTGNAWAAAGMARVLATVVHWKGAGIPQTAILRSQLVQWIGELIDGARIRDLDNGLPRNYLNDSTWFGETSGTALMAATTYRMAALAPERFDAGYIIWADARRLAIAAHITANGTLAPSVNPLGWGDRTPYTAGSPEGQSFGVLLEAAYRDYVCWKASRNWVSA